MGAVCGTDQYKELRQSYGLELTKMVISEKNKLFLDRIINKLKKDISEYVARSESRALDLVQEKQNMIDKFYPKVKEQLNQRQPGGIKSLEQMSAKTVDDMLGYRYIKDLLADYRANVTAKYKQQQNKLLEELFEIKLNQEQLFNDEKPNLAVYNQMENQQKESILKRGEMQFHDLVVKYQQYILSRYGHKLQMDYYINRIDNIDSFSALESIVYLAKDKFVTSLNLILSQRVSSYILIDQN